MSHNLYCRIEACFNLQTFTPYAANVWECRFLQFEHKLVRLIEPKACRLCPNFSLCPGVRVTTEEKRTI